MIFTAIVSSLFFYYEETFIYDNHHKHLALHDKLRNRSQQEHRDRKYLTLFGSNNKLYLIKRYSPSENTMFNAHILYLNPEGKKFKKFISAETIRYDYVKKVWHASNVFVRNWKNDEMQTTLSPSLTLDLKESIFHFQEAKHANIHLSSKGALEIAKKYEVIGGNYNYYYTEYYLKMAVPYIPVIILFFGIPVATFSRRMNMALSLLVVVIIAFCFFNPFLRRRVPSERRGTCLPSSAAGSEILYSAYWPFGSSKRGRFDIWRVSTIDPASVSF